MPISEDRAEGSVPSLMSVWRPTPSPRAGSGGWPASPVLLSARCGTLRCLPFLLGVGDRSKLSNPGQGLKTTVSLANAIVGGVSWVLALPSPSARGACGIDGEPKDQSSSNKAGRDYFLTLFPSIWRPNQEYATAPCNCAAIRVGGTGAAACGSGDATSRITVGARIVYDSVQLGLPAAASLGLLPVK